MKRIVPLGRSKKRGQALLMVTLALIAMTGLMELAVDFGWAFFVEKSAQAAADAAAVAAVRQLLDNATTFPADVRCVGSVAQCYADPTPCPTGGSLPRNLAAACRYAAQNGFSRSNTSQNVTVQASDRITAPTVSGCSPATAHPPTAPCADADYWVTVRVSQSIPQLFSAIFNNTNALISARSTAALTQSDVLGNLIALNRENDLNDKAGKALTDRYEAGRNVVLYDPSGDRPDLTVPGGIVMASAGTKEKGGGNSQGNTAGYIINNKGSVSSPFTYIRGEGRIEPVSADWMERYTNQSTDSLFLDPMRGKGQPPLNPNQHLLRIHEVENGVLNANVCPDWVCPSGNYVAIKYEQGQRKVLTGKQISTPMDRDIVFDGGSFGDFVFFGGLRLGKTNVTLGPGRYVMAGRLAIDAPNPVFETQGNTLLRGGTSETSDAGRILILTDGSYGGRLTETTERIDRDLKAQHGGDLTGWTWKQLEYATTKIHSGGTPTANIRLYGLNYEHPALPSELQQFGPVLIWQDQANSYVKYTENGNIDIICPGATMTNPCPGTVDSHDPYRPELEMDADSQSVWGGIIYQPRGAYLWINANSNYTGPTRIVTGGLKIYGEAGMTLNSPSQRLTRLVATLVE